MTHPPAGPENADWMQPDLERLLDRFELAWQGSTVPDLAAFLPPVLRPGGEQSRLPVLQELIKIDLEYRWKFDREAHSAVDSTSKIVSESTQLIPLAQPRLEDYLRSYPELAEAADFVTLVAEEYRVRRRWGDRPGHAEYLMRFESHASALQRALAEVDKELLNLSSAEEEPRTLPGSDVGSSLPELMEEAAPDSAEDPEAVAGQTPSEAPDSTVRDSVPKLPAQVGRYEVLSLLGEGAFGAVYLALDPRLNREVALKVPHSRRLKNQTDRAQFLREAQLVATLQHPALVHVFDVSCEGDECYMVMEYIQGQTLAALLRGSRLTQRAAALLIAEVAEAVHEAHKVGLVHCDLKPGNILIDAAGSPHVTDFGLAVLEAEQRSQAGERLGTPAYMAPEQVRGDAHRLDGRTDLWSLGVMLYEMLCARRPFHGENVHQVFDEIRFREPKPPRQIDDTIDPELERICFKCLSKDVTGRYSTGKDLAGDLQRFLESGADVSPQAGYSAAQSVAAANRQTDAAPPSEAARSSVALSQRSNLPEPAGEFIGRSEQVAELTRMLTAENRRLLTITGPGGIGKTRLSIEVARRLVEQFEGGCWLVDLTSARSAGAIAEAVLSALGVPAQEELPAEASVADVLAYRPRLLLVLDNFEQVIEHAEETVGRWRRAAPQVRFLVTSRAALCLEGEQQLELTPLSTPYADDFGTVSADEFESVRLFLERAREIAPCFTMTPQDLEAVAEICVRLDGLPLAVELAAARAKILKPAQILSKLDHKFQLLRSSRRDLSPRQQTLAGAIDWSYDLLSAEEQAAFEQLSVLPGGFFLEAAEAILDLSEFSDAPLGMDIVQSLREKCLLCAVDTPYELRFSMYKSIRDYGAAKRSESLCATREAELQRRMAEHLMAYAETWNMRLHTAEGLEALERIALEKENLLAAQDWTLRSGENELAARIMLATAETLAVRGSLAERLARLEQCLAVASESYAVRLNVALADACRSSGDWQRAAEAANQAVELARARSSESCDLSLALWQEGELARLRGDVRTALERFEEAERISRGLGDDLGVVRSLSSRGFLIWQQGHPTEAMQCYAQAEELARRLGDQASLAQIVRRRGHVLAQRGEYDAAMQCFDEVEAIARRRGDRRKLHRVTSSRAMVYSERGDYEAALKCYARAESIARGLGERRGIAVNQGNRGLALADLGQYEAALACFDSAERINRELENLAGVALNIANRAEVQAAIGDYSAALESLAEAERLHHQLENRMYLAYAVGDRGDVLLRLGRLEEARHALSEALEILRELAAEHSAEYFLYLTALACVCDRAGDFEAAQQHAAVARQLAADLGLTGDHPRLRIRSSFDDLAKLPRASSG